ncbi:uncharacterized protein METZ01_LOCUS320497 [marine metagenome]|uniref:Uncharacterized protein n=1 Tax=marine metagenome TaxID=408172 RepID=A0A382P2Q8_9ZZZZ
MNHSNCTTNSLRSTQIQPNPKLQLLTSYSESYEEQFLPKVSLNWQEKDFLKRENLPVDN